MADGPVSLGFGDSANALLRQGRLKDALAEYQKAFLQCKREKPESCLECGGPESYWQHIFQGHIMVLEILISSKSVDFVTGAATANLSAANL